MMKDHDEFRRYGILQNAGKAVIGCVLRRVDRGSALCYSCKHAKTSWRACRKLRKGVKAHNRAQKITCEKLLTISELKTLHSSANKPQRDTAAQRVKSAPG
jgi:hypothetical protein